jgi:hypothetical protein
VDRADPNLDNMQRLDQLCAQAPTKVLMLPIWQHMLRIQQEVAGVMPVLQQTARAMSEPCGVGSADVEGRSGCDLDSGEGSTLEEGACVDRFSLKNRRRYLDQLQERLDKDPQAIAKALVDPWVCSIVAADWLLDVLRRWVSAWTGPSGGSLTTCAAWGLWPAATGGSWG